MLKSKFPTMPKLDLSEIQKTQDDHDDDDDDDDDDDNNDHDDEDSDGENDAKNLVAVLLKVKAQKALIDKTKKRKHFDQLITETNNKFIKDNADHLQKFKKKWTSKSNQINKTLDKIKNQIVNGLLESKLLHDNCVKSVDSYKKEAGNIINSIDEIKSITEKLKFEKKQELEGQMELAKEMVEQKLIELEQILIKIKNESVKDDKISKMVKSIVTTM